MRKLLLILTAIAFIACEDDKKKTTDTDTSNAEVVKEPVVSKVEEISKKYNFKKVDNLLDNPELVNLTSDSHAFSDKIVFEEVNVLKTAEDTYSFFLVLSDKETDFEEFIKWTVAIVATPKNPKEFADPKEQAKGARTIGIYAKPQLMGNEIVIHLKDFKLKPKEFSFIRFYLYNAEGEKNTKYYLMENVTLP